MTTINARWRLRLKIRQALLASARAKLRGRKTTENLKLVKARRDQVAEAERVIARNTATISEPAHSTRTTSNKSSRNGTRIKVIVLHATEGSYDGAVSWLCSPQSNASAHLVISKTGNTTRLVADADKAWHVAADNPFTLGIEQEGYTSQTSWPDAQLREVAQWVAFWAHKYDIPITHSTTAGVCRHSDLGQHGGGHGDPGAGYPLDRVLAMARAL